MRFESNYAVRLLCVWGVSAIVYRVRFKLATLGKLDGWMHILPGKHVKSAPRYLLGSLGEHGFSIWAVVRGKRGRGSINSKFREKLSAARGIAELRSNHTACRFSDRLNFLVSAYGDWSSSDCFHPVLVSFFYIWLGFHAWEYPFLEELSFCIEFRKDELFRSTEFS